MLVHDSCLESGAVMPWCPHCQAYRAPSGVRRDGTCPACGTAVDPGDTPLKVKEGDERMPGMPWHLKVVVVGVALYLGMRLVQGIVWVVDKLF